MKSIMLNGVKVSIGSMVRFVDDENLYTESSMLWVKKPVLYGYYIVRGFAAGALLLDGIVNDQDTLIRRSVGEVVFVEPGFAPRRFVAVPPMVKKQVKINKIKIRKEVLETLDLPKVLEFAN